MKLPNFTLCRTCEEFVCLFIYFECGFLKFKLQENSPTSESKCQMGCNNCDEVLTEERKYILLVMTSLTSSSLPRNIPIKTDYPTQRQIVVLFYQETHLAFAIFPYFLLHSHWLLITDQPEFNRHPLNETKTEGENVTFTCDADGNPTPTFSWTKDGSVVNTSSRITFNENNKNLTITNVSRGDSGEYICVATNNVKTVQSNSSTLNVQCKDTFA